MKDRNVRLETIKEIMQSTRVSSQEELLHLLATRGFTVTQATLSRDLKYLRVGKVATADEGYYYSIPSDDEWALHEDSYIKDFLRAFTGIAFSGNMAVLKTLPGHANSLAFAIDSLGMDDWIVGTIAGDDTVLAVINETKTRGGFIAFLKQKFPGIKVEDIA